MARKTITREGFMSDSVFTDLPAGVDPTYVREERERVVRETTAIENMVPRAPAEAPKAKTIGIGPFRVRIGR